MTTTEKILTRHQLLEQPWAQTCTLTLFKDGDEALAGGLLSALGIAPDGKKVEAIAIQFDTIINWYAITQTDCPIDGTEWKWEYGTIPGFTSAESMHGRTDPQVVQGFELIRSRHRGFVMKCDGDCHETYFLHNFDR